MLMTLYMANVEYVVVLQAAASFSSVFVSIRYYCTLLLLYYYKRLLKLHS